MTADKDVSNGNMETDEHDEEIEAEEKKPGVVRKISRITFTIGPIKQEDLSTPELNKLMAMARKFDITFDTTTILDSEQTDKLGYLTLPFEIRTQEYLLVLYDRLSNLKLNPARDVSVKFPEEFKRHVEEVRIYTAEQRKLRIEAAKKKAELQRRSLYATYVDKDTGVDSLKEKFPEAKNVTVEQWKEEWFGALEFESQEKALEVMKANTDLEIDEKKVKLVRTPPNKEHEEREKTKQQKKSQHPPGQKRQQRGGGRGGMGNQGPRSLLQMGGGGGGGGGGRQGYQGGMGGGYGQFGGQFGGQVMGGGHQGRYQDYGGGYGGGYNQQQSFGGPGNFQLGAKRKSDYGDYGGSAKKPFGSPRGGYGGRGGGGWNRY